MTQDAYQLKSEIDFQELVIEEFEASLRQAKERKTKLLLSLKKICNHTKTTQKRQHIPGGYYDRAEFHTYDECTLCGERLNLTVQFRSYV